MRERLRDFLEYVVPAVHVIVAGKNEFSLGFAMQKAMRGATVIIMQNTGIWANFLAKEVLRQQFQAKRAEQVKVLCEGINGLRCQCFEDSRTGVMRPVYTCPSGRVYGDTEKTYNDADVIRGRLGEMHGRPEDVVHYILPRDARCERCMVFDAFQDTADTVVEKLTLTLNTIMGDDLQVLGFAKSEENRLRTAWMMESRFSQSAQKLKMAARAWHYSICIMSYLTTVVSVVLSLSAMEPTQVSPLPEHWHFRPAMSSSAKTALAMFCGILPLFSTFLISGNARFAPFPKYTALVGAAAKTRQAIYEYRARVNNFRSTRTKGSILDKLRLQSNRITDSIATAAEKDSKIKGPGATPAVQPGLSRCQSTLPDSTEKPQAPEHNLCSTTRTTGRVKLCRTCAQPVPDDSSASQEPTLSPSQRLIEVLTDIQSQVMAGDNKVGCLIEPSEQDWLDEVDRKNEDFRRRKLSNSRMHEKKESTLRHRNRVVPAASERSIRSDARDETAQPTIARDTTSAIKRDATSATAATAMSSSSTPSSAGSATAASAESSLDYMKDDLCSLLSAEQYVQFRIMPALEELKSPSGLPRLTRIWSICQTCLLLGTMATGILGVLGVLELIPILLTAMSSLESVIAFEQLQLRLVTTNQALQTLQRLMIWWNGLSMVEQRKVYNKEHLISQTEAVVNIEANVFGTGLMTSHPPHATDEDGDGIPDAQQREKKQEGGKK